MKSVEVATLATLRAVVGYLGEREQHGWWQSSFFSAASRSFLAPLFARTVVVAQCSGAGRAAALKHDAHIGVGHVYHLFRLPEDLEQALHHALHDPAVGQQIARLVADHDAALAHLRAEAGAASGEGIGPTQVGAADAVRERRAWRSVAAQYAQAFTVGAPVYPYFAARL